MLTGRCHVLEIHEKLTRKCWSVNGITRSLPYFRYLVCQLSLYVPQLLRRSSFNRSSFLVCGLMAFVPDVVGIVRL